LINQINIDIIRINIIIINIADIIVKIYAKKLLRYETLCILARTLILIIIK